MAEIQELEERGPAGVEALCHFLRSEERWVVTAAAEALGRVGDVRALTPLTGVLRAQLSGGSAQRQIAKGLNLRQVAWGARGLSRILMVVGVTAGIWAGLWFNDQSNADAVIAPPPFGLGGFLLLTFSLVGVEWVRDRIQRYFERQRSRSKVIEAICRSLAEIVERHPAAPVAGLAPELREIARDRWHQTGETREVCRRLAHWFEAIDRRSGSLPVPAGPLAPQPEGLPLPGEGGREQRIPDRSD
ncbi:MAG: HEAT repeat domain-containing protein [Armatimonadetes bacterium]|nr:HEAT repeat domain-containing protein [Armatimonadota bacterium]